MRPRRALTATHPPCASARRYPKDANEALRGGCDLEAFVSAARPLKHDKIVQMEDLRNALYDSENVPPLPEAALPRLIFDGSFEPRAQPFSNQATRVL